MYGQKIIKIPILFFDKSRLFIIVNASTHQISVLTLSNPIFQFQPPSFRFTSIAVRKVGTILYSEGKFFKTAKLERTVILCSTSRSRIC